MKKIAFIFALSVLAPSLVLAWLAIRSLSDQKIVFERQQTLLYQGVCNSLVKDIVDFIGERETEFGRQVETLIAEKDALEAARQFDARILPLWPFAEVGFAVTLDGQVLAPPLSGRSAARHFRLENELFLSNKESVEVFWRGPKGDIPLSQLEEKSRETDSSSEPKGSSSKEEKSRKIFPQKDGQPDGKSSSRVSSEEAEFRHFIGDSTEGILARFLQNKLKLLVWYRSPRSPRIVFGAQLKLPRLEAALRPLIQVESSLRGDLGVALLDDNGKPVAPSEPEFTADWKHPFVSVEIGEVLPHWEVAAYLRNPAKLTQSARTLTLTLTLLVCVLLLTIGVGAGLIGADIRRQLRLTRQKTDFVSNVSHELKTPLTSIRMFSELLAEARVTDPAKQRTYLNVIASEAARLTRLINNVLDFARLERGEKKYDFQKLDLVAIARDVAETYRPHLETSGFQFDFLTPDGPAFVMGDRDALAQVIVNLLSNAEKYSGQTKEIVLELCRGESNGRTVLELRVLDRGLGVPGGHEDKIFEQFYRAHDSLSSGIPGSGLGLTLARQIARAHGGDIVYQPRAGGGSSFVSASPGRMKTKILIIEDDPHIRMGLEEVLKIEGFEVATCSRGDKALEAVSRERPGLILLDIMLPGLSGYDVCKQMRAGQTQTPILMLTAKGQELDKVAGLEMGADDYVTKPFGLRELLARIHALLRRTTLRNETSPHPETFQFGAAEIDPSKFEIRRGRSVEKLSLKELKLLQFFRAHPEEVLSRDRLLSEVWGYNYHGTTRTLDQVIVQLRRKIGDNGSEPKHIRTIHGVGYKLVSSQGVQLSPRKSPSANA